MTGNFTRPTVCSIISSVMSFPLESGCKSRGFECNSQIYWKVFFIILKQFYRMRWLSAMLDNIFFTYTRKPEEVWHLYYIYNALWSGAYHLKKIREKGETARRKEESCRGKQRKQHGKKGKTSGQKRERWLKIKGTEPRNSGRTPEKQRPRHCKFPEEISEQKKNHPKNEKDGWRKEIQRYTRLKEKDQKKAKRKAFFFQSHRINEDKWRWKAL